MLFFFHKHEFCNLMYNISVFEGNTCLIEGHIYQTILGQFTVHISIPFISYLICFIIFITDYGLSLATRFSLFRTLCLIFFLQEEEHFLCRLTFTEVIKTHQHQQRNKSTIKNCERNNTFLDLSFLCFLLEDAPVKYKFRIAKNCTCYFKTTCYIMNK